MAKPEQVSDASLTTARLRCIPLRLLRCLPFFGGHRRLFLRFLIRLALFGHAIRSSSVRPSVRYPKAIRAEAMGRKGQSTTFLQACERPVGLEGNPDLQPVNGDVNGADHLERQLWGVLRT